MGVKDYLVIQAFPEKAVRLWFCRPNLGELPSPANEAVLETLGVKVLAQGQKVRMFDREGKEILPPMEMLERERQQREQERQQWKEALEQERRKREELERRVAELEQKLQQQTLK
jgi:chromosome segregation ATPase